MQRLHPLTSVPRWPLVAVVTACGGGTQQPAPADAGRVVRQRIQINGAGATFPYPIYSKWFAEYNKLHPNVQINYQSIGSGGGIRQVVEPDRVLRRHRRADDRRAAEVGARDRSSTSRPCSARSCPSTTCPASTAS